MLVNVIGVLGVVLLLGSFLLNSAAFFNEQIKQSSSKWALHYSLANFLGAGMLAYYAYALNNIIFLIVEGTWSVVGLAAVVQNLRVKRWVVGMVRSRKVREI
jgi:hypothetical protein